MRLPNLQPSTFSVKLGIYGGSFDPVHLGHLLVAQAAIEELGLDRLFFIPAAQSPFKPESQPAPAAVRLQLLRLALAGKTNCEIDEQEIRRAVSLLLPGRYDRCTFLKDHQTYE